MGVSLPVGTPSMLTCAPDGNDVIFSAPLCAAAGRAPAASRQSTSTHVSKRNLIGKTPGCGYLRTVSSRAGGNARGPAVCVIQRLHCPQRVRGCGTENVTQQASLIHRVPEAK